MKQSTDKHKPNAESRSDYNSVVQDHCTDNPQIVPIQDPPASHRLSSTPGTVECRWD